MKSIVNWKKFKGDHVRSDSYSLVSSLKEITKDAKLYIL